MAPLEGRADWVMFLEENGYVKPQDNTIVPPLETGYIKLV
jgi:hypothetical protein